MLMLLPLICFCQINRFGINAGFWFGRPDIGVAELEKDNQLTLGYNLSATVDYKIKKWLLFSPEFAVTSKSSYLNWKYTRDRGNTHRTNLTYLELPLLIKFIDVKSKKMPYFELGPSVGYAISARESYEWRYAEGKDHPTSYRVKIKNTPIDKPHFSLNAGIGFIKNKNKFCLGGGIRYQHSLNKSSYVLKTEQYTLKPFRYSGYHREVLLYFKILYQLGVTKD